jgi:hypothetical protein
MGGIGTGRRTDHQKEFGRRVMTARPRCAWILLLLLAQEAAYPVVRPDDRFPEGYAAAVLDLRFGLKDLKPPVRKMPEIFRLVQRHRFDTRARIFHQGS